ncbi:MAG: hypothetical protein ACHQE5_11745, partial [Actinomycetes bacterium]
MGVTQLGEGALRRITGGDAAGQTAALVATAAIGASFGRGLMPRRSIDQAIATGVVGATQYGLVVTSQSISAAIARTRVGKRDGTVARLVAQAAVTSVLIGAGTAVARMLPPRPGEPV